MRVMYSERSFRFMASPNVARESVVVAERSLRLTRLWTESHSPLRLEGRASLAQRDPARSRIASSDYRVRSSDLSSFVIKYAVVKCLGRSHAMLRLVVPGCAWFPQQLIQIRLPAILPHINTSFENDNVLHDKAPGLPIISPAALLERDPAGRRDDTVPGHIRLCR